MLAEANALGRLVGFREIKPHESKRTSLSEMQAHILAKLAAGWKPEEEDVPVWTGKATREKPVKQ